MFFKSTPALAQSKNDVTMQDVEDVSTAEKPSLVPADETTPSDVDDERTSSIKGLIYDAASNTGAHGLPNIVRAKSVARRTFWILVFLAALGERFPSARGEKLLFWLLFAYHEPVNYCFCHTCMSMQ